MKWLNIIGIGVSVLTMVLTYHYINEVNLSYWYSRNENLFGHYPSAADVTFEAGLCMVGTSGFFIFQSLRNLIVIKLTTTKTLAIIALSLVGLAATWNFLLLSSPGHISFDEGGQLWLIVGLMMLAFSIVFLIQTNKFLMDDVSDEILDDEIL